MNARDVILPTLPLDMPKMPSLRLILKHSQERAHVPLTGFRRGWFFMIRRQCAWAVQLWPVAQVWVCTDGLRWRRNLAREQSLEWLNRLRHSRFPIDRITRQAGELWVEDESPQMVLTVCEPQARRYWWNRHHGWRLVEAIPPVVFANLDKSRDEDGMALLKFFQLRTEAIELFQANRGVGYLLAFARQFRRGLASEDIAGMVGWPQRRILKAMGFPGTELMRLAMRRMQPESQAARLLKSVRRVYHGRATGALLQHTHSICWEVIHWLDTAHHREFYTPKLIAEFAALDSESRREISRINGFELLAEAAKAGLWKKRPILSLRHLSKQVAKVRTSIGSVAAPLPAPPTEGDLGLVPLCTATRIIAEGRAMQHCLGFNYHLLDALHGSSHFYQVLTPKRGTLEVRQQQTGRCELGEFEWENRELPTGEEIGSMDQRLRALIGPAYQLRSEGQEGLLECPAGDDSAMIPRCEQGPLGNARAA